MLKRTLFFQSPGFLKLENKQLCFNVKSCNGDCKKTVPLEDIGMNYSGESANHHYGCTNAGIGQ